MTEMTPEEEYAFYLDPAHLIPQGPPVRRTKRGAKAPDRELAETETIQDGEPETDRADP